LELELRGDVAVVVGGAKGIGRAIAAAFAGEAAETVLVDVDPQVTASAEAIAEQFGVRSVGILADATQYTALTDTADRVANELGACSHLVYAAGVGSGKYGFPFWNLDPQDWDAVLRVNLVGAVHAAHAFTPQMIEQRYGTLLYLSSIAGQIGSQTDPPYSAAKAGLINFAQCAAKDLAKYDVRVNTICPGMIKTTVNRAVWQAWCQQQPADEERQSYEDWAEDKVRRVAPLGRWQTVEDIAALALFLASPRANNITGQTMNVDGGQVMHW